MPTKNPRCNITIEPETINLLNTLAKQQCMSVSALAKELILEALERREDRALSKLAESREAQEQEYYTHEDAWK